MTSEVEYRANFNFWTQNEKWKGFFFVVWLTIKDIPNRAFRQIINEYNEHKSVTASRDTQEIYPAAGAEMLKIFSEAPYETSILDDFKFYEKKQDHSKVTTTREEKDKEEGSESKNLEESNEESNEENLTVNDKNEKIEKNEKNFNEPQLFNSNMNKGPNQFQDQVQGQSKSIGFYMNRGSSSSFPPKRILKRVNSTEVILKTRKDASDDDENDN